jgi:hypothetical protein
MMTLKTRAGLVTPVMRATMSRELEVLRQEYKRAAENPIFDDPKDYCILLDLITDRMEEIEERYANN